MPDFISPASQQGPVQILVESRFLLAGARATPPPRMGDTVPPAPRIRPLVEQARAQQGAESAARRAVAAVLARAIFQHARAARQRHYVEYVVWRLLEEPAPRAGGAAGAEGSVDPAGRP